MASLRVAALSLCLGACSGFEPVADLGAGAEAGPADGPSAQDLRDARPAAVESGPCPAGIAAPVIDSFAITDNLARVVLGQEVSLVVKAHGAAGQPLHRAYAVAPFGDAVKVQPDGSGRWALTSAKPVFFSTSFTLTATVRHACGGPAATASVKLVVLGNVLVADRKHASIEALGSGGQALGQVAGAALLTTPGDLALLSASELAVADSGPKLVKVIDLGTGALARSFGGDAPGLSPDHLLRTAKGELLVGFAKNQLFRYSAQGKLLQTITAPTPYGCAGLAELADGSLIVGTNGSGALYRIAADGTPLGPFANPGTSDTNSLLRMPSGELLMGTRSAMNDGVLLRLSGLGAVQQKLEPPSHTFYFLRRFVDGYLFVHFFATQVYRLDETLAVAPTPFATLPSGSWAAGLAWLDGV